jgi:hypothetical protein
MILSSKRHAPQLSLSVAKRLIRSITKFSLILACLCLSFNGGCNNSGFYPVQGKVIDETGQPVPGLEGSEIVFSQIDGKSSSIGELQPDGSFRMFTDTPGDGVPPGDYKVYIPRRHLDPERQAPQTIEAKFEKIESSSLEAKVEKKRNTFEFKVKRFVKK